MDRQEAMEWLRRDAQPVEPGQRWQVDLFRPEDAPGVARLYFAVYGDAYPVDTPYIPDLFRQAVASGEIVSVVARSERGDILGKGDIFVSSPPNSRLREIGQLLVLPAYRHSFIALRVHQRKMVEVEAMAQRGELDGAFGETVTNHVFTQKLGVREGYRVTALEAGLLPAEFTAQEAAVRHDAEHLGRHRESCLLTVKVLRDRPQVLHLPPRHLDAAARLLEGMGLERTLATADQPAPEGSVSEIKEEHFAAAGVLRAHVTRPGADLPARIAALLERTRPVLAEVFLALDQPWAGACAEALRPLGFRLGGLAPLWCGPDALLLLRTDFEPNFDVMKIFADDGRLAVDLVRADRADLMPAGAGA